MRVAICEDDFVYRSGLQRVLMAGQVDVVAATAQPDELMHAVTHKVAPDVVLLDIRLRDDHDAGVRLAEQLMIEHPGIGILLLSAGASADYARRLFARGTAGRGYALKENFTDVDTVLRAITAVARGRTYTDPEIMDLLVSPSGRPRLPDLLTPRELEVIELMAEGLTNAAIAKKLLVAEKSVEYATRNIFRKLQLEHAEIHNLRVLAVLRWMRET